MPNIDIINGEIADLENKTMTYAVAERLAWLYIIRDHCCVGSATATVISSVEPVESSRLAIDYESDTDFSRAINGKKQDEIWPIMDELMETIHVLVPRLYDGIMRKLQA